MVRAHDGVRSRSVASARAGDGSFLFLSRPALDFAITSGVEGYEALRSVTDLQSWIRAAYSVDVDVSDDGWGEAQALRRAIWHLVRATLQGTPLPGVATAVVNAAARPGPITRQLGRTAHSWRWQTPVSLREVLSAIARDAVDLLAVEDRERLRECAADNCALIFFDDSRSGRRRWCAPQRCGDRERARDYRSRQRSAT